MEDLRGGVGFLILGFGDEGDLVEPRGRWLGIVRELAQSFKGREGFERRRRRLVRFS